LIFTKKINNKKMKLTKEQKPSEELAQSVDVELNEEQLEVVAGGVRGSQKGVKDLIKDVVNFVTKSTNS
jgi:predicted RNase H-related nuclease YkuK (DUF458 family)